MIVMSQLVLGGKKNIVLARGCFFNARIVEKETTVMRNFC